MPACQLSQLSHSALRTGRRLLERALGRRAPAISAALPVNQEFAAAFSHEIVSPKRDSVKRSSGEELALRLVYSLIYV